MESGKKIMRKPHKPEEPYFPESRQTQDYIEVPVYQSMSLEEIGNLDFIKYFQDQFGNWHKNLKIEGEWKLTDLKYEGDYDSTYVYLVYKGGKISWDNPNQDYFVRRYKKAVKDYPKKLKQYEEKLADYNEWKVKFDAEQVIKDKEYKKKEKTALEKKLAALKKELGE